MPFPFDEVITVSEYTLSELTRSKKSIAQSICDEYKLSPSDLKNALEAIERRIEVISIAKLPIVPSRALEKPSKKKAAKEPVNKPSGQLSLF